jgi:hypothetical protein
VAETPLRPPPSELCRSTTKPIVSSWFAVRSHHPRSCLPRRPVHIMGLKERTETRIRLLNSSDLTPQQVSGRIATNVRFRLTWCPRRLNHNSIAFSEYIPRRKCCLDLSLAHIDAAELWPNGHSMAQPIDITRPGQSNTLPSASRTEAIAIYRTTLAPTKIIRIVHFGEI